MTLVKFNQHPVRTFGGLVDDIFQHGAFNKLWKDDLLTSDFFGTYPPVNIQETKEAYAIDFMVPGLAKEDFKINVENNKLTVSAEKKAEAKEENEKHIRREFSFRSFKRSFVLNEKVDAEKIQAKYENGILKIQLSKKEAKQDAVKAIVVE